MDGTTPDQARTALEAADRARARVADAVGLPRVYWWAMAAGWLVLGVLGDLGPAWLATVATVAFGIGHSVVASRLLDGRRGTDGLRVAAGGAGRAVPVVVGGILVVMVLVTVGAAFALLADGAHHPGIVASLFVAVLIGFGGPEILRVARRWVGA